MQDSTNIVCIWVQFLVGCKGPRRNIIRMMSKGGQNVLKYQVKGCKKNMPNCHKNISIFIMLIVIFPDLVRKYMEKINQHFFESIQFIFDS